VRFDIKLLRLATQEERDHLYTHKLTELLGEHIALTVIDDDNHFYFAVGSALRYEQRSERRS
jgi:hypothetical protein